MLMGGVLITVLMQNSTSTDPTTEFFKDDKNKDVTINFFAHGKPIASKTKSQLISELGTAEKRLYEYHEAEDATARERSDPKNWVTFGVIPARAVLDRIYGDSWRQAEQGSQFVFTCVDNYQPSIPVERFLNVDGFFAVYRRDGRSDDAAFKVRNRFQGNRVVPLGPLYLNWDKMDEIDPTQNSKVPSVPYQIVGISLVGKDYGKISVSQDATERVARGAEAFRSYCFNCHRVNGSDGGSKGPDLGMIARAYEGREGILAQFILDPRAGRPYTGMEPLSAVYKGEPEQLRATADLLIDFLKDAAKRPKTR